MRKFALLFNLAIILSLTSNYSYSQVCSYSQIPTNFQSGLVAYYPFCGNANDISGNGNSLQSFGLTSTTDRFGNANSAYSFSNTQTNVTSYLKAVSPSAFATPKYTISAWFNTSQFYPSIGGVTYNYQSIVFYSPQTYTYGPAYHLALQHANNSVLEGGNWTTANTGQGVTSSNGSITTNQWYHAVLTYDGSDVKMYLNGVLIGTTPASISYANQIQFLIGGAGDGPSPGGLYGGFNGKLDDIGFWNKALTGCEISQLYSQTGTAIPQQPASFAFNPLQDTTKVCGASTLLNAGSGFSSYQWSSGATTQTFQANTNGMVKITVANSIGCTATDSSVVDLINARIVNNDTSICSGATIQLNVDTLLDGFRNRFTYLGTAQGRKYFVSNANTYSWPQARDTSIWYNGRLGVLNTIQRDTLVSNAIRRMAIGNISPITSTTGNTWIGLYQNTSSPSYSEPGGGWQWLSGDAFSYSNWASSEPNNNSLLSEYAETNWNNNTGQWNDRGPGIDPAANYGGTARFVFDMPASNPLSIVWSTGATTSTISVSPTQTTTYYVTISDGINSCVDSVKVTVISAPNAGNLSGTQAICLSGTTTFSSTVSGGSWTSSNTSIATVSALGVVTGLGTGTATITYTVTASSPCQNLSASTTRTVTVSAPPSAGVLSGTQTICIPGTTNFSSTVSSGTWFSSNSAVATVNSSGVVTGVSAGNTAITYTVTGTGGCSNATTTRSVTVSNIGVFNPLIDTTRYCGTATTLDAGSGYTTYLWNTGATTRTISPSTSGVYNVAVTNLEGCSASDTTFLSISNANILNNDTTICKGSNVRLSVDSVFTGRLICNKSLLPASLKNGLVAYYPFCGNLTDGYSGNSATNFGSTMVADRFNNPSSAINFNGSSWIEGVSTNLPIGSAARTVCFWYKENQSTSFGNNAIAWGPNVTGNRFDVSFNHQLAGFSTGAANSAKTYQFLNNTQVTSWNFYCAVVPAMANPTVSDVKLYQNGVLLSNMLYSTGITTALNTIASTPLIIGKNTDVSSPAYLNGSIDDLSIFNRALSDNEIASLFSTQNTVVWSTGATTNSILVSPTQSTTYYVTVSNGITSCVDSVRINVSAVDTSLIVLDPPQMCAVGGQVRMQSGVATSYQWQSSSNGTVWVNVTGATNSLYTATATGYYRVFLTNALGCTDYSRAVQVVLNPQPVVSFTINNSAQCLTGNSYSFTNTSTIGGGGTMTYYWNFGDVGTATTSNATHTYAAAGSYTVKLIATSNNGCKDSTSQTVTVTAAPSAGTLSGNQAICAAGTTTFSSTVAGGTWTSSNTAIATVNGSGLVTAVAAGSATITYTVAGTGGCANATATRTVTVSAAPSAGILSGTQAVCIAGTATFSSSVSGGTWTSSNTAIATINASGLVTGVTVGTATITYTVAGTGGCSSATATRTVTVSAPPNAGTLSGTQAICILSTTTFRSTVAGGTWTSSNTAIATVNASGLVTGVAVGTATITYTVAGTGGCANATATRTITISSFGLYNPLSDTTRICGSTTALDAGAGYTTYLWNTGATTRNITPTTGGSYSVTVTSAVGCSASDTTFLSLVKANIINNDTTICKGSSVTLSIDSLFPGRTVCSANMLPVNLQNGLLGFWPFCGNSNNVAANQNHVTVNGGVLTTDRFNVANSAYYFNNTYGEATNIAISASGNISVSYWQKLFALTNSKALLEFSENYACNSNPQVYINNQILYLSKCSQGTAGALTIGNAASVLDKWVNVTWTVGSGVTKLYVNGSLVGTANVAWPTTSLVRMTLGNAGNTASPLHQQASNVVLDDIFLYTRTLSSSEVQQLFRTGSTVLWSTGATTNSITVSPTQSTTYYVTVSDGVTSCIDSVRVNVSDIGVFNPLSDTTRICGSTTTLDAGAGYTTYLWNTGATTRTITPTTGGSYIVTVTNAVGCSASDSTFLSLVKASIINNDTTICKGSSVTLSIDSLFPGRTICDVSQLPTNLRNGLVAYYPFCGNANDASGNGNNGIVNGATLTSDRFLNPISAYSFSENNYIELPTSFGFTSSSGDFTVSLWFKSDFTQNPQQYFLDLRAGNGNRFTLYQHTSLGTGLHFSIEGPNGSAITPPVSLSNYTSRWTNMVGLKKIDTIYLFLNGVLVSKAHFTNSSPYNFTQGSCVNCTGGFHRSIGGSDGLDNNQFTIGKVDDIQIWNRSLSFSEINSISSSSSVSWSTGATTNSITVSPTQSTTYYVTVSDGITSCVDSVRVNISTVDTSLTVLDPPQVCAVGGQVRLQAGVATSYIWQSSPNGTVWSNIVGATGSLYTATVTGYYRVKLVNALGCTDYSRVVQVVLNPQPVVSFTVNSSVQCLNGNNFSFTNTSTIGSGGTMTYYWNFGDAGTATTTNASHTYATPGTYIVKLIATSNNGCIDSTSQTVTVNPKPTVSFTINNSTQCVNGNSFLFTSTSTISSGTLTYAWSFGDGGTATTAATTYSYSAAGAYTVKLVVTSNNGCKDSTLQTVIVNPKPTVSFTINNNAQCVNGNSFVFTNTSTIASGTMTYAWDFGDAGTSASTSPTHTYSAAGNYIVKLVATSNNGCMDSTSVTVTVNPKPTANFTINQANQCLLGNSYVFTNASTIASGTMTHAWDFGDAGTATTLNATHVYTAAGNYNVRLISTSASGCADTISKPVIVYAQPTGTIATPTSTVICQGSSVTLTASGGATYQWYLNAVAIAGATSATLNATQPGVYTVKIISVNGCFAMASNSITLTLVVQPQVDFSYDKYCAGFATTFTNTSVVTNSGTVSYIWNFGDNSSSTQASPTHTYVRAGSYTINLSVTPTACPALVGSKSAAITVVPALPNLRYTSVNAVSGQNQQLSARLLNGATYAWNPPIGLSSVLIKSPVFNHTTSHDYLITINTVEGCVITDSLLVRIFSKAEIYVSDAFTPNGDNKNDKLMPRLVGIERLNYFRVYDRWGQQVYVTSTEGEGWDGTFKGAKQPIETYTWIAEGKAYDGTIVKRAGSSVLIR